MCQHLSHILAGLSATLSGKPGQGKSAAKSLAISAQ
jgi:hypothetical protein